MFNLSATSYRGYVIVVGFKSDKGIVQYLYQIFYNGAFANSGKCQEYTSCEQDAIEKTLNLAYGVVDALITAWAG